MLIIIYLDSETLLWTISKWCRAIAKEGPVVWYVHQWNLLRTTLPSISYVCRNPTSNVKNETSFFKSGKSRKFCHKARELSECQRKLVRKQKIYLKWKIYYTRFCSHQLSEQFWTGLQSWPRNVTCRRGSSGEKVWPGLQSRPPDVTCRKGRGQRGPDKVMSRVQKGGQGWGGSIQWGPMSEGEGQASWGSCMVRSNASWVIVT